MRFLEKIVLVLLIAELSIITFTGCSRTSDKPSVAAQEASMSAQSANVAVQGLAHPPQTASEAVNSPPQDIHNDSH